MRKILIILFLFCSIITNATTYHVAKTGLDSNPGTLAQPFLTLIKGESALVASHGDSLLVHAGTYIESAYFLIWQCDGTLGDPTVIMAYPGDSPIIDGSGIDVGANGSLIRIYASYITLSGFEVRDANMDGLQAAANCIYSDGSYNTFSNLTIHNTWGSPIIIYNCSNNLIEYCTVYDGSMNNENSASHIAGGYNSGGIQLNLCSNSTVRHCTMYTIWGEGLSAYNSSTNITFEDNIIYDIWTVALYISDSQNCLVQRNLIYHATYMTEHQSPIGIGLWNERYITPNANITVINNIVYDCGRNLHSSQDIDNEFIFNNTFVNSISDQNTGFAGVHSNSQFKNNILIQEGALPIYYLLAGSGITFSNNLYNKAYDSDAVGAGNVTSVAHFTDSATHDYTLKASSPAINAGASVGVNTDFLDSLRDASPDIGAYEYDPPVSPPSVLPSVITLGATYNVRSGIGTGNITSDGDGTISAGGVCWSTSANPDTGDSKTTGATTEGAFTANISGLVASTTYYLRTYATNESGTSYGQEISFTTPASSTSVNSTGAVFVDGTGKVLIIE